MPSLTRLLSILHPNPGSLPPAAVPALRAKINALCGQLAANGGALALALCDGFGIPDHLLQVGGLLP